jgi:ABC-type polar amino acid transport system ATPase subunit
MITPPTLSVVGLHKSFGETKILENISFINQEHEVTLLIGESGSGKSTLLKCIDLLDIPDKGEIRFNGILYDMKSRKFRRQLNKIRSKIGFVSQDCDLWPHRTVLENITEAMIYVLKLGKKESETYAKYLLQRLNLYDRRDYYPKNLSGGETQRVAIARVLALDLDVILFDEPTAALDPINANKVIDIIHQLSDIGKTMIISTHQFHGMLDMTHQVLFLHNSRILEQGTIEVVKQPKTQELRDFIKRRGLG